MKPPASMRSRGDARRKRAGFHAIAWRRCCPCGQHDNGSSCSMPRGRPLGVPQRSFSSLWHRLSDARERSRSRGPRARCVATVADRRSPPGSRSFGIPRDDGDAVGDQRHEVGALAPGDVYRTIAPGTHRSERRSSRGSRTTAGTRPRRWLAGGKTHARRTQGLHPSRSVRLSLP